jgi:hypothetical protein
MASSRRRFVILACVLGAATLVVGIGVASGKKLTKKSESETLALNEFESVTARCETGTKAISGGFEGDLGLNLGDAAIETVGSLASGGREWTTNGYNFEDPGELTSFAYCIDQKVKRKTKSSTIPSEQREAVTAKCPEGKKAISGGFNNPTFDPGIDPSVVMPFRSKKDGKREWEAGGATVTDKAGTFVAQVNCREGKKLKTVDDSTFIDDAGIWSASARCPSEHRVISGGFDYDLFPTPDAFVFSSHRTDKRTWEVSVVDFQEEAELTAYAYCEKKKAK